MSYLTVRTRLDKVIAKLQNLAQNNQAKRLEIIRALENHEITVVEAAKKLNVLGGEQMLPMRNQAPHYRQSAVLSFSRQRRQQKRKELLPKFDRAI